MIDKILFQLLLLDENETNFIDNANTYFYFQKLIKELTKVKYNIRCCSNEGCKCHPEYCIKQILEDENTLNFLNEYCYKGVVKDIKELTTDYKPIIAKGIYEN